MFAPRVTSFLRSPSIRTSQCLRQRRTPAPRNPISSRTHPQQCRYQSTAREQSGSKSNDRPKHSFFRNVKILFQHYPFSMTAAFFSIGCGVGALFYANYYYQTYIIGAFHKYPEPVAKQLRKALYYTNMSLEPKNALKYYKESLRVADEVGMDPFSDEVMGIKIQIAALMEKIQLYGKAIDVLEIMRGDCGKWMEMFDGRQEKEIKEKRTRVLRRMVELSVKLAELYQGEFVLEGDLAEERLVWAVETVLKEERRREKEGKKEGEDGWLSREEMGGAFESLAHIYEENNRHHLAAPLFLQAITFATPPSCHTAVLMNNLSISLAQQNPPDIPMTPTTHTQAIQSARAWAIQSLNITSKISAPERTEECDIGCAVATHNLGEFAEMLGDKEEARKRYVEAIALGRKIGFKEGVERSEDRLRGLGGSDVVVNG